MMARKQKILSLSLQPLFHFRFYWIARSLYYKELWHYKFILCWIPLYFANAFEKIISVKCSEFQSLLYKAEKLKCSTVSFYKDIFLPIFHMTLHKKPVLFKTIIAIVYKFIWQLGSYFGQLNWIFCSNKFDKKLCYLWLRSGYKVFVKNSVFRI